MPLFTLQINGKPYDVQAEPDMPLLWVLRDILDLTGTKFGCGVASCGACTVLADGGAVRACVLPVQSAVGMNITTIEGLSTDGSHPIQKAWEAVGVPQCGYCQSGQMMTLAGLLTSQKNPSASELSEAMSQVLCRCGTYHRIRQAALMAIDAMNQ
jgi:isoquinoline 1-oxidoreductase subunit alpha